MEDKIRAIESFLDELDMEQLVPLWNEYCEAVNYMDDMVENMDAFDELMTGMEPHEIAQKVCYGDFNYAHNWFSFNGYGNLVSFGRAEDENSPIYTLEMAEYIVKHDVDFGCDEVRELLDGTEEEEE